jgi:hypothetical protein
MGGLKDVQPAHHLATIRHNDYHEWETEPAGPTYLPDVEHLLVVTQESPSPDKTLTLYTWISYADVFYLALDIIDSSSRGDRNLKGMRIGG